MTPASRKIRYLLECLQAERASAGIRHVESSRILHRHLIAGRETATADEFASFDLAPSVVEKFTRAANLRHRDTELVYASFAICGQHEGKPHLTPVLLHPVTVDWANDRPVLRLEHQATRVNPALHGMFEPEEDFDAEIAACLSDGCVTPASPGLLAKTLARQIANLDTSPVDLYPQLAKHPALQQAAAANKPSLLPASWLLLCEKSRNVAGLLLELETIATLPDSRLSSSLRTLLGEPFPAAVPTPHEAHTIPAVLSESQLRLLTSLGSSPVHVCQGPPGTGKSFTIAALTAERIVHGQSVLIVCRSDEAADVIHSHLTRLLPDSRLVARAGRKTHLRNLRLTIERLLANAEGPPDPATGSHRDNTRSLRHALADLARHSAEFDASLRTACRAGQWLRETPEGWWKALRRWFTHRKIKGQPLLAEWAEMFQGLHQRRLLTARRFHRSLHHTRLRDALADRHVTATLKHYLDGLRKRFAADQERVLLETNARQLFRVFPVWITTSDDLHRVLPLVPGSFDIGIIDEATQCDIASALPVFQRSNTTLVTGDLHQLRHVSFLSDDLVARLATNNGLTDSEAAELHFRKVSLLDRAATLAPGSSALTFLDEHYRSLPGLIRFSNERYYDGALHFMREPETLDSLPEPIHRHHVAGERNAGGTNQAEIELAIRILRQIVEQESSHPAPSTIGFLSPFRAQVDAFAAALETSLEPLLLNVLLKRHRFAVGTGHSFQGNERDIMILSMVIDADTAGGALRFLERPDVFNVSITRARNQLHLIHSVLPHELPSSSLLRAYLLDRQQITVPGGTEPPPLRELPDALACFGWSSIPRPNLAGIPVDLLLRHENGKCVAIDLVGTPGDSGEPLSLPKALLLTRAGVPLYPVGETEWLLRKTEIIEFFRNLAAPR